MSNNPKDIILDVLSLIDYQGNKKETAETFMKLCYDKALINMIDSLTNEEKTELQQKLSAIQEDTSDEYKEVVLQYFTKERYINAVRKASEKVFAEYLTSIMPSLTNEQQDNLFAYLGALPQSTP